jgi:myo-inositol-1-phosphate synthase
LEVQNRLEERSCLESKRISKTESVQNQLGQRLDSREIHIGPSDDVPWQNDNKIAFIRLEGRGFGGVPLEIELRLSVEDSLNSAGIVIDAVRCAKLGLDRGLAGSLEVPSAYFMKSPPIQMRDDEAVSRSMRSSRTRRRRTARGCRRAWAEYSSRRSVSKNRNYS